MKVTVTLRRDDRLLAERVVEGEHRYRFSVPPGDVVVTSDQGGTTPAKVTIEAGHTTVANLPSTCR
jgi:hypothetical protein